VKRRAERLAGWIAILACLSVAVSILMTPSWTALGAGGLVIVTFAVIGRSLLKPR
jgi:hypothetical protein